MGGCDGLIRVCVWGGYRVELCSRCVLCTFMSLSMSLRGVKKCTKG